MAGRGLGKGYLDASSSFPPVSTFSATHICFLDRTPEQGNIWKKSSATEKTLVDLCVSEPK